MRRNSEFRLEELVLFDKQYWEKGLRIAGMDEVGRGPLAGCVLAACVIMPEMPIVPGIDDSKVLSPARRQKAYELILANALFIGLGRADAREIDDINILQATRKAMQRASQNAPADVFLVDAMDDLALGGRQVSLIKGDATSYSIAAASIVAKVVRDREMVLLSQVYPEYHFAQNKGYGSAAHIQAITEHGSCPLHRRSFLKRFKDARA